MVMGKLAKSVLQRRQSERALFLAQLRPGAEI